MIRLDSEEGHIVDRPMCSTCPYWDWQANGEEDGIDEVDIAECHRGHPVALDQPFDSLHAKANRNSLVSSSAVWPQTWSHEWCGEHPDFPAYLVSLKKAPQEALIP